MHVTVTYYSCDACYVTHNVPVHQASGSESVKAVFAGLAERTWPSECDYTDTA